MGTALVMDKRLQELITTAMKKGYVLYDEIDDLLPEDYSDGPEIDDILAELTRAGIEVLDEPRIERDFIQPKVQDSNDVFDDPVDLYLRELATVPVLTPEGEMDLAKRIKRGGSDAEIAIKDLLEANLWLVVAIAKRFPNEDIHILDLIQEGNTALLNAGHKFNPARGYRFSTFAAWCVRRTIRRKLPDLKS
jgi:RNA polymerase primary sigma factor